MAIVWTDAEPGSRSKRFRLAGACFSANRGLSIGWLDWKSLFSSNQIADSWEENVTVTFMEIKIWKEKSTNDYNPITLLIDNKCHII